jgi:hypothetical protein
MQQNEKQNIYGKFMKIHITIYNLVLQLQMFFGDPPRSVIRLWSSVSQRLFRYLSHQANPDSNQLKAFHMHIQRNAIWIMDQC